ncbi:MAG: TetR/AcrR family transcriptional regulator [Anaerolineales bacterium]
MQQRSLETRARLLDAALKRFARDGYNATSVETICADAGVSKGAFYHHFPSKQALFLALLEGWLTTIQGGLEASRRERASETLMEMSNLLPSVLDSADARLPMFLEFLLQAMRDQQIWQATIEPYRRYRQYFAQIIQQGIADGSFGKVDPQIAGQILVSLALGLLLQGLLDPEGGDWEKVAQESMKIFLKGLANA